MEKQAAAAQSRAQSVTGLGSARRLELARAKEIQLQVWVHTLRHKAASVPDPAVRA